MNKLEARSYALQKRKEVSIKQIEENIIEKIIASKILEPFQHIGIYYPIGKEMNLLPLTIYYKDKEFYLPITKEEISFVKYSKDNPLVDGPFHTKEPKGIIKNRDEIECFIIPCVAVSLKNQRLGYGKGYYDRYLSQYKGLKIGIVYSNAILDIDMDSYDLVLDIVYSG